MEHKQDITVNIEVKEVIFDIMNKTHLTGHAREAAGERNYEAASYMQASEDDEQSYQIRRSVSNAFAELKVLLGEYLTENKTTTNNRVNKIVDNIGLSDEDKLAKMKNLIGSKTFTDTNANAIQTAVNASSQTWEHFIKTYKDKLSLITAANAGDKLTIEEAYESLQCVLVLNFEMPSNFHNAAIDSLGGGCHQYIVNKSIGDWFTLVNKPDAADYITLAQAALDTAKRALYKRARPQRPSYSA